jgi:hypothetical protein
MIFKVADTEIYARIHCKFIAKPLGSAEHTLETSRLNYTNCSSYDVSSTKRSVRCFGKFLDLNIRTYRRV